MDNLVKKELKTTSKIAVVGSGLWIAVLALICCGGSLIILVLISGGTAGLLGFLSSNIFLILLGIFISLLAILWFIAKFMTKN